MAKGHAVDGETGETGETVERRRRSRTVETPEESKRIASLDEFRSQPEDPAPAIRITRGGKPTKCQLLPPQAFPATQPDPVERELVDGIPARETGPNSRTVRVRLASSCAGWPVPPNAREFHAAVRSTRPTVRQCAILRTWAREATSGDIVRGWLEEAYTWPVLVAALHRTGAGHHALNELLNGFAKAGWSAERG